MNRVRRKKLIHYLGTLFLIGLLVTMVMYALRQNISLFFTPSEIAEMNLMPSQKIRVGGQVVQGSVVHGDDLLVSFQLTDLKSKIQINYQGVLPDLFRENQGIVVEGNVLQNPKGLKVVDANRVLAKHDENYMPPEVHYALEKANS